MRDDDSHRAYRPAAPPRSAVYRRLAEAASRAKLAQLMAQVG